MSCEMTKAYLNILDVWPRRGGYLLEMMAGEGHYTSQYSFGQKQAHAKNKTTTTRLLEDAW